MFLVSVSHLLCCVAGRLFYEIFRPTIACRSKIVARIRTTQIRNMCEPVYFGFPLFYLCSYFIYCETVYGGSRNNKSAAAAAASFVCRSKDAAVTHAQNNILC